jgi:exodeoxyribonuclease VII small subunit
MAANRKKFEDELKDLEGIVAQIDSGELSLEDSIAAFERGVGLVRSLNEKLDEVERKVELLMRNAHGDLKATPFDPAAAKSGKAPAEDAPRKDDDDTPF